MEDEDVYTDKVGRCCKWRNKITNIVQFLHFPIYKVFRYLKFNYMRFHDATILKYTTKII